MRKLYRIGQILLLAVISQTALAQSRPVVGVAEFKNETGAGWFRGGVGWELSGVLANELAATGDFRVVERAALENVLREQDLAASGRVASGTGASIGEVTGAQYIVMGTVTSYEENVSGTGGGISIKGFSIGGKKESAYLAIDLRVIDTTTGVIEYVRTVEGRAEGGGVSFGVSRGGYGGQLASENKTPTGKAIRAAMIEAVDYLACVMVYQDQCLNEYGAKERRRRNRTKDSIKLD